MPALGMIAAPNNGMHPTADTLPVKFLQRFGAAGEILCWVSSLLCPLRVERLARLEHPVS